MIYDSPFLEVVSIAVISLEANIIVSTVVPIVAIGLAIKFMRNLAYYDRE